MPDGRQVLKALSSPQNYGRYAVDLYLRWIWQALWRQRGVQLGQRIVWLGRPIVSLAPNSIIRIGDRCLICSRASQTALGVNHPVILRTLQSGAELSIGSGVRMSGTTICAVERVIIGDRCVIGANVTIADTDFHALEPMVRSSPADAARAARQPTEIEADVFIGGGSIVLKGVTVGHGAVIGAGSVVVKNVPALTIVAGNPAKPIGFVTTPTMSS